MVLEKNRVWRGIPFWFAAWSSMLSIGLLFVSFQAVSWVRRRLAQPGGTPAGNGFLFETTWKSLHQAGFSYQFVLGTLAVVTLLVLAASLVFWLGRHGRLAEALYGLFYALRPWLAIVVFCFSLVYFLRLPIISLLPGPPPDVTVKPFTPGDAILLLGCGYVFVGLWLARPLQSAWLEERERKFRAWLERLGAAVNRFPSFWSGLAMALLPVGLACAVVYGAWHARLSNYRPAFWNDAVGYWLWVRQFAHVCFGGGYNYPNELAPAWNFNHFGEGSPLYVYLYGTAGKLFGWQAHLPILVNFALISLALWLFSRRARLDTLQNLILAGALAVSWPIWLFLLTASHETLNQALGTALALGFLSLRQNESSPAASRAGWLLLGIFAALTRLSWVILIYPLLFYSFSGSLLRRAGLALAAWIPLAAAIVFVTRQVVPPIQNSIFAVLGAANGEGARAVIKQFFVQLRVLVKFQDVGPSLLVVILMLILAGMSVRAIVHLRKTNAPWREVFRAQEAFDAYNMLLLLAAGMTLYLAQGFYRVFFAALWVSLLMHIAERRYAFVRIFIVASLFFLPSALNYYGEWDGGIKNYTLESPDLRQAQPVIAQTVVFDDVAESPWCNTILIPIGFYDSRLTLLPPGIGISYYMTYQPMPNLPVRSKYLWLDVKTYNKMTQMYSLRAELLTRLSLGNLYRNLDADCPSSR